MKAKARLLRYSKIPCGIASSSITGGLDHFVFSEAGLLMKLPGLLLVKVTKSSGLSNVSLVMHAWLT